MREPGRRAAGGRVVGRVRRWRDPDRRSGQRPWLVRGIVAVGLDRWARLVAVAIIPLLLPNLDVTDAGPLFPILTAYVLITALLPRHRFLQAADLLVAAALILLTGEQVVPYLPFILVAVAGPAAREGVWAGLASGGVLGSMLLVAIAFSEEPAAVGLAAGLAMILLPPLAGFTAAAATEALDERELRDRRILEEANRLLSSLRAIADEVPGGLDLTSAAGNLMAEVRDLPGVQAALLLSQDGTGFQQAGRTGRVLDLPGHLSGDVLSGLLTQPERAVSPADLPAPLDARCADVPVWLVASMGSRDDVTDVLLIGFDDPAAYTAVLPQLRRIADDASLALDNARLFEGTRSRAVDAARRQLAADLHDGVAQSLAHLRMELELLAMRDASSRTEAERLATVAESALLDLRRTISGLRLSREDALSARLERHLREVRTPHGPRLDLIVLDEIPLDATATEEAFRVAQEAVSNALRHAEASEITVVLDRRAGGLLLSIEDDGIGLDPDAAEDATGVGLASMRERARRLQAELRLEATDPGGTRVVLELPVRQVHSSPDPRPASTPRS